MDIIKDGNFESSNKGGHVYYAHYYPASGNVSKNPIHLIFQHGAIEYQGRYLDFFEYLRSKYKDRLVISAMDFLGHGKSGGSRSHIDKFETNILDFCHFTKICSELSFEGERKTFFVGHSMGGLLILETLIDYYEKLSLHPDGMILSNPALRPRLTPPKKILDKIEKYTEKFSKLRLPVIHDGFDLTSDKEKAISFLGDELNANFMTLNLCLEVLKHASITSTLSYYLKTPTLFLLSGHDKVIDPSATELFLSATSKDLSFKKYYPDAKHDLLNEKNRKTVYNEINKFIETKL